MSITSFALYGFPESHAASFALIAYASAYLKVHYPAAFYTALLNNQPMGFYHPATLVKDAQRRGVRFAPIDVQVSGWDCTVEDDGSVRLGLRYVTGLRAEAGKSIASRQKAEGGGQKAEGRRQNDERVVCPKCGCDDASMIEEESLDESRESEKRLFCNVCSNQWVMPLQQRRFRSIDELVRVVGLRRDEVTVLAEIGALNSFGLDRRSALWQAERAVRPAGELFEPVEARDGESSISQSSIPQSPINHQSSIPDHQWTSSPLPAMGEEEKLVADYAGSGLTIGRHPMAFRRHELSMRGVLRAIDLPRARAGRRVRTAGMVITRQRPGTAKGFVFLTLEDETGIANVIIRPDVYAATRLVVIESPFLLVEGILQNQGGVTSVRAERLQRLDGLADGASVESHDFH